MRVGGLRVFVCVFNRGEIDDLVRPYGPRISLKLFLKDGVFCWENVGSGEEGEEGCLTEDLRDRVVRA